MVFFKIFSIVSSFQIENTSTSYFKIFTEYCTQREKKNKNKNFQEMKVTRFILKL